MLPWHVVRAKLATKGVVFDHEQPSNDEPSATSGLRLGEKEPAAIEAVDDAAEGLSFKVYTLAELEQRGSDALPPLRMSMAMLASQPKAPSELPWVKTGKALLAVVVTLKTWALSGKGRPAIGDAILAPGGALKNELEAALATVEWKRLGVALGIGLGIALFLLFTVLTVAELTDDLKPASADGTPRMAIPKEPAATTTVTSHTSQPVVAAPTPAPAPEPVVVIDLDDIAPVEAPPPKPARPAKKPAPKTGAEPFSP